MFIARSFSSFRIGGVFGMLATACALISLGGLACGIGLPGLNFVSVRPEDPQLSLPPGFVAGIFAAGLDNPRFMTAGPAGVLLVAERGARRVVALPDVNRDGIADEVREVLGDLIAPSSLAFRDGLLYIGETTRITRVKLGPDLSATERTVFIDGLPAGGSHTTRTIAIAPDGRLFVAVGSSCNVCNESDPRRAAITVFNSDGSGGRLFATGLRNAVGLDFEPATGLLWASNNGRDFLGDDVPPETVYIVADGIDAGWPRCHAGDISDPGFAGGCDGVTPPVAKIQAHSAPLGVAFCTGTQFPESMRGHLFVALHGSFNRTVPVGYKVMRVPVKDGVVIGEPEDFATGWLRADGAATGRPAGVVMSQDGALLVSDDAGGRIIRISHEP